MATRLALVGCKDAYQGPWTIAKGNERGLQIIALGEGALIRFEAELVGDSIVIDHFDTGEHSLPNIRFQRYRVSKIGDSELATIVRVILDGLA